MLRQNRVFKTTLVLMLTTCYSIGISAQKYKQMMEDVSINFYDVVKEGELYFNTIDKSKKGSGYKPFVRWVNNNEYLYYPTGRRDNIDPYFVKKSFETYKKNYPEQVAQNKSVSNGWRELGPNSIDLITGHYSAGIGRVEDAYIVPSNPQKIYLGSRSGGLWRTTDEGQTWTGGSTDFLPVSGVNTISGNPLNSDHILMNVRSARNGTSYGIYESIDGGATVTETNFNPTNLGMGGLASNFKVNRVSYHPTIENLVFVATNTGIFRSTDGLTTWTEVVTSGNFFYVYHHPTNPMIVYAINRSGGSVRDLLYKSVDAGVTFTQTEVVGNNEAASRISISADEPNSVFWASTNGLWKSIDSGDSFAFQNTLPGVGTSSFVVSDTDVSQIIMGYVDIYNSTDTGVHFEQQTRWSLGSSALHPSGDFTTNYETSTGYVHADANWSRNVNGTFYVMTDGTLAKSEDGGDNWTNLMRSGVGVRENYKLGISQSNNGVAVSGSQDNGSSIYKETGWIEFYGADGMEGIVHPLNDEWIMSSVQYGGRRKTKDGGYTQSGGTPSGAEPGAWEAPLAYDPNDHMSIYDFRDGVRKSIDFASTYTLIGAPSFGNKISEAEVAQNNSNIVVVARGTAIEKSTDGGATFIDIKGTLPNNTIQDIAFDPLNDDTILVGYASNNNNGNKIYVTFDGGTTWNNISYNLFNMPVRSVVVDHSTEKNVYLGTEVGVFTMPLAGDTWVLYNPDLPSTTIEELEINWGANTIKAATWGRGLWEYDLVDRANYPSINYTEITDVPTDLTPKEGVDQYVTSKIVYAGTLSSVYVRWSIDTPDFSITDNTIAMSNVSDDTWVSDSEIPNQPEGTKVYFKVFAEGEVNDISETYKFMYTVTPFEYCTAQGSTGTGSDFINRVTLGDIFTNESGQDQYTFYDALEPIELITGETYEATVRLATAFSSDLAQGWIDFNNNAIFEDDESFNMGAYTSNIATGSIVIPDTAVRGKNLRLRFRNSYWGDVVDSCGENAGEVEDYMVFIPFVPPTVICQNTTLQLDENGQATLDISSITLDSAAMEGGAVLSADINTFACDLLGVNEVTLTITDAVGGTSSCSALVTVEDNIVPTVIAQDITVALTIDGDVAITASQIDNGSSDNCQDILTAIDITNFNCSDLGANTVALTVTDNSNNVSTTTAVVTVIDNMAPEVLTQNITVGLDDSGAVTIMATDIYNGNSDNCAGDESTLSVDISSFTCDNIGDNTVILSMDDFNGNTGTNTAIVTVEDMIAPVIDCPEAMEVDADEDNTYEIPDFSAVVTDNCTPSANLDIIQTPLAGTIVTGPFSDTITVTATDESDNSATCTFSLAVNETLGTGEFSASQLSIYPNPAKDLLYINTSKIALSKADIYDLRGRKVLTRVFTNSTYEIDISILSKASYFMYLYSDDKVYIKRLLKN